jgi:flagellar biosynthesis protein FlhG
MTMPDQAEKLRRLVKDVAPGVKNHKARRIAFLSGKGGVGKTSIAVNIALALARMNRRTILIDCDIGLANADILLGVRPRATLDGVLLTGRSAHSALLNLPSGLWLLPGAASIVPRQATSGRQLENVLKRLDDHAEFIIMDGGAGIDEGVQHIARLADEVVIIAAPESTSAVNAYRLIKVILGRKHAPLIRLIINRAQNDGYARRTAAGLMSATREFLSKDPDYVGWIPDDPIVQQAGRERRPFVEKYPGSLPARAVVALAHRLIQPPQGPTIAA